MKIIGFVPAKGSSTRVPDKNAQTILGVPLFLWAANNMNRVLPREDIYIDSDCPKIRALAETHGFGTIERPADLATNATNGNEFMLWQASQVDADIYVQHLAPMPFLKKETLEAAINSVKSGDFASSIGVRREQHYPWNEDGPAYDILSLPNSFELPESISEGMGLYVMSAKALQEQKIRAPLPCHLVDLDTFEAIDIDYPIDLELARAAAAGLPNNSPYLEGLNNIKKASTDIRLLVLDVDGVMTDGGMYYSENGDQYKKFNAKDGMAISYLQKAGVEVAFLSSGYTKKIIPARADTIGVKRVYVGRAPKLEILDDWRIELDIDWQNIAYLGDDINDIQVMEKVGFKACPADAVDKVKKEADIVLSRRGGDACVRELIDQYLMETSENE